MKKLIIIGLLILTGCYMHIPDGIRGQSATERFLDTLYRPDTVQNKIGVGFITIKDYLNPSKQKVFQLESTDQLSANEWLVFTGKVNDILSKNKSCINGTINVESYEARGTKYMTAFFVDSSFRKVVATLPIKQKPDSISVNVTKKKS